MANLLEQIKQKAAEKCKTIVLCEGEDKRVVEAAAEITNVRRSLPALTLPVSLW